MHRITSSSEWPSKSGEGKGSCVPKPKTKAFGNREKLLLGASPQAGGLPPGLLSLLSLTLNFMFPFGPLLLFLSSTDGTIGLWSSHSTPALFKILSLTALF